MTAIPGAEIGSFPAFNKSKKPLERRRGPRNCRKCGTQICSLNCFELCGALGLTLQGRIQPICGLAIESSTGCWLLHTIFGSGSSIALLSNFTDRLLRHVLGLWQTHANFFRLPRSLLRSLPWTAMNSSCAAWCSILAETIRRPFGRRMNSIVPSSTALNLRSSISRA